MASKVFVGWNGDLSLKLGEALWTCFLGTFQYVQPYFTHDNSTVLILIGWDVNTESNTILTPCSPRNLDVIQQGHLADVQISFGPVRSYIVRREQAPGQSFIDWFQAALVLITEIKLTNQPRFIKLEYRMVAIKASFVNTLSNVVSVVL